MRIGGKYDAGAGSRTAWWNGAKLSEGMAGARIGEEEGRRE